MINESNNLITATYSKMQDKAREQIQQIRQNTKRSLFKLSLDIGMSETTLSRFLRGDERHEGAYPRRTALIWLLPCTYIMNCSPNPYTGSIRRSILCFSEISTAVSKGMLPKWN